MNPKMMSDPEQHEPAEETPEDVAILYSWANLHGAKYRDFSASRREYRAQIRHRAAEDLRLAELRAKEEAEVAAATAEQAARDAERTASRNETSIAPEDRESAVRAAENNSRRAAAERLEAARRAEAAALAEAAARREEREIAEAHASAQRQAARYADSEIRRRTKAGPQPAAIIPGQIDDPYVSHYLPPVDQYTPDNALNYTQPDRYRRGDSEIYSRNDASSERPNARSNERPSERSGMRLAQPQPVETRRRPQGYRPDEASGIRPSFRPAVEPTLPEAPVRPAYDRAAAANQENYRQAPASTPYVSGPDRQPAPKRYDRYPAQPAAAEPIRAVYPAREARRDEPRRDEPRREESRREESRREESRREEGRRDEPRREEPRREDVRREDVRREDVRAADPAGPAWLYAQQPALRPAPTASSAPQPVADTLQHSRERVASRWFALKGVFDQPGQQTPEEQPRQREVRVPVLTVFSLAGGVGKTSLVATLGRALSSMGEKVLLADTTSDGLLPYYFGATELRPGVVRTFSPPSGSTDAPIHLVSYDIDRRGSDRQTQDDLAEQVATHSVGTHRLLLDVNGQNGWIIRRIAKMNPTVLVPLAPDMNSIISLQSVERYLQGVTDREGRALQPYYVLNQFDASLPLHLDVREVLRRQLGDRLLPPVIRRAPAVSESLAEGMTVVDYAPEAQVADDYLGIANWLRGISAPASSGFRTARWSER